MSRPLQVDRGLFLLLALVAGCGGDQSVTGNDSGNGRLTVTAATTGAGQDLDGYLVGIDSLPLIRVPANGSISLPAVAEGSHLVTLWDVADNCSLTAPLPPVVVLPHATTTVTAAVGCHIALAGRVVFTSEQFGQPQVMAMYPDGSQRFRVTEGDSANGGPAVSPDGARVAFARYTAAGWRLRVLQVATGLVSAFPVEGVHDFQPSWSPDGTRLVYEVNAADQSSRIWVVDADGQNPHALTTGNVSQPSDFSPAWSPDGQSILFSRNGTLELIPAGGGSITPLPVYHTIADHPAWSPDGAWIAYTGLTDENNDGVGDNYDLYRMSSGGGGDQRLTSALEQEGEPAWSPDGTAIVFERVVNQVIYLFRLDLGAPAAVKISGSAVDASATWGPSP